MRDTFIKKLEEKVKIDKNIFLITGDLGFGVFDNYRKKFPSNFINAGVAEQNMTGVAVGMALDDNIVFTYSIANFSTLRCIEQIRNDACYHNANVKVVSVGSGFSYGQLGVTHHATEDITILRSLPDITIFAPSGLWEVEKVVEASISHKGTCYIRLDKSKGDDTPLKLEEVFEIGKGRVIKEGSSCTVFTIGGILEEVQLAAIELEKENISVRIVTFPTLKPIDKKLIIDCVNETKNIISVEEHNLDGGLGSIIAEVIMDECIMPKRFLRIGLESQFSSIVGSQKYLREQYNMDAKSIVKRIKNMLNN